MKIFNLFKIKKDTMQETTKEHSITEEELNLNPQLKEQGVKVGDQVKKEDIVNLPVNNAIGAEAEATVNPRSGDATSQPTIHENNKINVVDSEGSIVRTFSGEVDGQNWKKLAEAYAGENGYYLEPYHSEEPSVQQNRTHQSEVIKNSDRFYNPEANHNQ